MKLTLIDKKEEVPNVISFYFQPEQDLTWKAGQFMRYHIEDPKPDERNNRRFFTIASSPSEKNVRLTTRFVPGDGSSFKQDLLKLNLGDQIEATGPGGQFIIKAPNEEYVFIAGGIGITPFRSILVDLDQKKLPINVTLLYANRSNDIVYKQEFEEIASRNPNFKIQYFIDPQRIDETAIKQNVPDFMAKTLYISGPESMVEAFEKILYSMGISKKQVIRDYFPGYTGI